MTETVTDQTLSGWLIHWSRFKSALLSRQVRCHDIWKTRKVTTYPIHSHFIVQFEVLRRVRIDFSDNVSILFYHYFAKAKVSFANILKTGCLAWPKSRM
jgi:hypothetical protein